MEMHNGGGTHGQVHTEQARTRALLIRALPTAHPLR